MKSETLNVYVAKAQPSIEGALFGEHGFEAGCIRMPQGDSWHKLV